MLPPEIYRCFEDLIKKIAKQENESCDHWFDETEDEFSTYMPVAIFKDKFEIKCTQRYLLKYLPECKKKFPKTEKKLQEYFERNFNHDNDQIETCQKEQKPLVSSYNFITMENGPEND